MPVLLFLVKHSGTSLRCYAELLFLSSEIACSSRVRFVVLGALMKLNRYIPIHFSTTLRFRGLLRTVHAFAVMCKQTSHLFKVASALLLTQPKGLMQS